MDQPITTTILNTDKKLIGDLNGVTYQELHEEIHKRYMDLEDHSLPAYVIIERRHFLDSISGEVAGIKQISDREAQQAYEGIVPKLEAALGNYMVGCVEYVSDDDVYDEGAALNINVDWKLSTMINLLIMVEWDLCDGPD